MTAPVPRWDDELRHLAASGEAARLRREAGIRQRTMAKALGVSASGMSYFEHGRKRPGMDLGLRWLRILRALAWHEQAGTDGLALAGETREVTG